MSLNEIQGALVQMKNRKAAGSDGINLELLKYDGRFCGGFKDVSFIKRVLKAEKGSRAMEISRTYLIVQKGGP